MFQGGVEVFWRSREYAEEFTEREWRSLFRRKVYDELVWAFTMPYLPREKSLVLDAGGGSGRWTLDLTYLGHHVVLLDFSRPMLSLAKEKTEGLLKAGVADLILADIHCLPFRSETFDFIFVEADPFTQGGTKEDVLAGLRQLHQVLKPGRFMVGSVSGRYAIVASEIQKAKTIKDVDDAIQILKTGKYLAVSGESTSMLYLFTPSELRKTLKEIGFSVEKIESTVTFSDFLPKHLEQRGEVLEQLLELETYVRGKHEAVPYSRRMHFAARKQR
jgi:SAM-dependent methyltransferase